MSSASPNQPSPTAAAGPGVLVWLRAEQASLVRLVAAGTGLAIVGAGGPGPDRGAAAAAALGVPHADDLRAALSTTEATVALLADPGTFGEGSATEDASLLRAFASRAGRTLSLEPLPAALVGNPSGASMATDDTATASTNPEWARFVPLARWRRPMREALELLESFGPVRSASLLCLSHPSDGSLGARLFDALDLLSAFLGHPETVDAAFVGTEAGRGIHALPGENLRGLHGDMTANLRFADGRSAALFASDQAGTWERSLTLVGPGGRLRVSDAGLEWIDAAGRRLDKSRAAPDAPASPGSAAAEMIAEQVRLSLSAGSGAPCVPAFSRTLAAVQAALLSARTREGEHPGTLLRMAGLDEHG
ncbi:MAG: hypothetical protein ACKVS8_14230 [Phycisphaerales bacterium]